MYSVKFGVGTSPPKSVIISAKAQKCHDQSQPSKKHQQFIMRQMKAWAQTKYGGVEVLKILGVPIPTPGPRDLLVKVLATATNPVDGKVRSGKKGGLQEGTPLIVGWDAAGIVEETGPETSLFKKGDEIFFAGSINRPGCNAEYTLVDERIVGRKPRRLSFLEAAGEPLTTLTAWEGLIDGIRIPVPKWDEDELNKNKVLLITAGAGGVGSVAIQIAKRVLKIGKVIATASRPETNEYCKRLGADEVIDHTKDFAAEFERIGVQGAHYILNCVDADSNFDQLAKVVIPFGGICAITPGSKPIDLTPLCTKSVSFAWEFMFARSVWSVEPERQGQILNYAAQLLDAGVLVPRVETVFEWADLPKAQALQDSGKAKGKIALNVKF